MKLFALGFVFIPMSICASTIHVSFPSTYHYPYSTPYITSYHYPQPSYTPIIYPSVYTPSIGTYLYHDEYYIPPASWYSYWGYDLMIPLDPTVAKITLAACLFIMATWALSSIFSNPYATHF